MKKWGGSQRNALIKSHIAIKGVNPARSWMIAMMMKMLTRNIPGHSTSLH
jgi:hypothetical protein